MRALLAHRAYEYTTLPYTSAVKFTLEGTSAISLHTHAAAARAMLFLPRYYL